MVRRWFAWGTDFTAEEGDRVWRIGARDQELHGGVWTIVCCDQPMTALRNGRLCCGSCSAPLADVPFRTIPPGGKP